MLAEYLYSCKTLYPHVWASLAVCVCFYVCVLSHWWLTARCPVGRQKPRRRRCLLFHQVAIVRSGAAIISVITTQCLTVTACASLTSTNERETVRALLPACCRIAEEGHCVVIWWFFWSLLNSPTQKNKKHLGETLLQIKRNAFFLFLTPPTKLQPLKEVTLLLLNSLYVSHKISCAVLCWQAFTFCRWSHYFWLPQNETETAEEGKSAEVRPCCVCLWWAFWTTVLLSEMR